MNFMRDLYLLLVPAMFLKLARGGSHLVFCCQLLCCLPALVLVYCTKAGKLVQ